jgi:hypothetical protein
MNFGNDDLTMIMTQLGSEERLKFENLLRTLRVEMKLSEAEYRTVYAFRFFRGHKYHFQNSLDAIRANIHWRKNAPFGQAIDLDLTRFDFTFEYVKMGFYGVDFEGRPIRIIKPSDFDPKILFERYSDEDRYLYSIQIMERIINIVFPMCSKLKGRYIEGMVTIIDIKDLNISGCLKNAVKMNSFRDKSKELQDNYPEMAHKVIIINAGFFFTGLWNIAKLFLNKLTLEKITIIGKDYIPELLKVTSLDRLPVSIGGQCEIDINSYPNFFNEQFNKSIKERRLQ